MRELAFRAWHKEYGMIHSNENFSLENAIKGEITFFGSPTKDFETGDFIFMQYIGIKDKNGVEIYEGDIIKADWHWVEPHQIVWPDDYYWLQECGLEGSELEVIGNIYQNPELLEVK